LHLGKNRRENSLIAFTSKRHRSRLISVFCLRRHVTSTCSWMHASPCFIHIRSVVNANFDTVIAGGQYCGPNFKQRRLISFIPVKYTNRNLIKHCQCLDCSRPTGNNVKKYISASTRDVFAPGMGRMRPRPIIDRRSSDQVYGVDTRGSLPSSHAVVACVAAETISALVQSTLLL